LTEHQAPELGTVPPPETPVVPSRAVPEVADLIWEDEPSGSSAWWLSRSRAGDLQIFIAADQLTSSLLCLGRSSVRSDDYDVLLVIAERNYATLTDAVTAAKQKIAAKVADPLSDMGRTVLSWRIERGWRLALNQMPLAVAALALGALLGLAVALFAVSTELVGWPMLVTGIVIGAASGPLLKFLIDKRFKSQLGPWGRFWVATFSAAVGALAAAGGLLTLFWT
jgi:hypothetical protein